MCNPKPIIEEEFHSPDNCPAAIHLLDELKEVKDLLKEINDRSIADHTELAVRKPSVDSIPKLNEAYERGKGAFWAFLVFLGMISYFISDIIQILKVKYLT